MYMENKNKKQICLKGYKRYIITFIVTLFLAVWALSTSNSLAYGRILYIFMIVAELFPPILCLIAIFLKYKFKEQDKKIIDTILIIFIVLLPVYYFCVIFIYAIGRVDKDITNPKYYHSFVYGELYVAFPKEIPSNVTNVKFFHRDPFLQGGLYDELYYIDNSLTQEVVDNKFSNSIWSGELDSDDEPRGTPYDPFYFIPVVGEKLDFKEYVFKAYCYKEDSCNHGETIVVFYNDKTKELLYFHEDW